MGFFVVFFFLLMPLSPLSSEGMSKAKRFGMRWQQHDIFWFRLIHTGRPHRGGPEQEWHIPRQLREQTDRLTGERNGIVLTGNILEELSWHGTMAWENVSSHHSLYPQETDGETVLLPCTLDFDQPDSTSTEG